MNIFEHVVVSGSLPEKRIVTVTVTIKPRHSAYNFSFFFNKNVFKCMNVDDKV